jgi:Domain of unknown function DUF11/WD40-like Beta Propeller Repeat
MALSADGRYVTFVSSATNLVKDDTNKAQDVFVYDKNTHKIERVSISSKGVQGNLNSKATSISGDGRYVTFTSAASNLVKDDTNKDYDIFVHDRLTHKTEMVSVDPNGIQVGGMFSRISADGRYIVFESAKLFIHDLSTHKTKLINVDSKSYWWNGENTISFSADGRYIAFVTNDSNLIVGDTNNNWDVFVHDLVTSKTTRISGVQGCGGEIGFTSLSANGRYVAFKCEASNLVANDTNNDSDIFVHDRVTQKNTRVSVKSGGVQNNDSYIRNNVSLSADGRFVTFIAVDNKAIEHIFVHDLANQQTSPVSINLNNEEKGTDQYGSGGAILNADGRYVVFASFASNLVSKDTNGTTDIFVRDLLLDTKHHTDLKITPTTKPITLKLNAKGNYLYTITNNGKDTVPDVSLIHLVSGGSAVSFKPSQGKCSFSTVETVCHLGKLAAGQKLTLQATVKAQSKSVNQQITVSGAPVDNAPNNNHISVATPVR